MKQQAARIIVEFVIEHLATASIDRQITIYQALAETLPTKREREAARKVATSLSTAAALQLDFRNQLFGEPKGDGEPDGGPEK